ncbi:MAG: hypothetical protein U0441_21065 [Polyangiaceae bacterium]
MKSFLTAAISVVLVAGSLGSASADEPPAPKVDAPPAPKADVPDAPPPPPPAPYSLPWQLRSAAPGNVVRLDTAIALYDKPDGKSGMTVASLLFASYKVTPEFAPFLRMGALGTSDAAGVTNLALGGTLGVPLPPQWKAAFFCGLALPIASGGGVGADPKVTDAMKTGPLARSAMDNAMFAVNDLTLFPGFDVAYVAGGLTVQAEVTLLALMRARTEKADSSKTNLTSGVHVGYFFTPWLSAGVDLRYQRWLSTPVAVATDPTGDSRDNATFAIGPRFHLHLSKSVWLRPGVAYARGIDLPMSKSYNIVQIDIPVAF